jgi:hypothetical protein
MIPGELEALNSHSGFSEENHQKIKHKNALGLFPGIEAKIRATGRFTPRQQNRLEIILLRTQITTIRLASG